MPGAKQLPSGSRVQVTQAAGTGDMLAWLDAHIAAKKASIVG